MTWASRRNVAQAVRPAIAALRRCAATVTVLLIATTAGAQMTGAPAPGFKREAGQPAGRVPAPLREIGFDQNMGAPLPLDAPLRDEAGRTVRLGDYFGERPVVMAFAYYECPMLCTLAINGLASALNILSLDAGRDFEVVIVSFDPRDTPAAAAVKKAAYLSRYKSGNAEAGWHFLSGDRASIEVVTKAAGFRYAWDAETNQWAHPAGVMVLTPDGRLARYLFGIEYGPRDLRFALVEASAGKVGSRVDSLLLYCYHYDPTTGRYGLAIMGAIRLAGATTVLALGTFILIMIRRDRGARAPGTQHPAPSTQHPAPSTLHPAPSTLHPAPCTLHPAPSTQHPAPSTQRSAPSTQPSAPSTR